ncbi:hypothetical protein JANAI62_24670 [Jannaschia pagri]|uniref:Amino acid adenylation domain-containing protein n=1 Tax=Jannaschia pagri TaxID=2829797 RepID=A0ABQ4NN68_9RHOB|nr:MULTISPECIES: non-ribosomal peptide synthetase/type I polyketide synthase [unclassified Jannaschia]GIT92010.1 hypothetical protein JANAI61_24680 [Jannaschia sp. AI_61]GIT95844.1 hypothetical protein JANAI62_24670 [Jannaschia sp. AI_62]
MIGGTIHGAIAAQAAPRPEAVALRHGDTTYTRATLHHRTGTLAAALRQAGVAPGDAVAVYGGRSADTVVAMLAVLSTGATAVPLDPDFAAERTDFILQDAGVHVVVTSPDLAEAARDQAPNLTVIQTNETADSNDDRGANREVSSDAAAFLLYTSGTTGRPKGVRIPHRAVTSYEFGPGDLAVGTDDVVLHTSTPACDGMLPEVFGALIRGAQVAVVGANPVSVSVLRQAITDHNATVLPIYTGLLNLIIDVDPKALGPLRLILTGGESISPSRVEKLLDACPSVTVVNEFGPTETCIASLAHVVTRSDLAATSVPIGTPLANEWAIVLDTDNRPVPDGTQGILAIGGAGLALGYHNRPELTAAAFIPDPRSGEDGLVYRTGDLATRRADGVFLFHGREDRQCKIAGRRVELDGIEAAFRASDTLIEAVVEPSGAGAGTHLVAFVQRADPSQDVQAVERLLRAELRDIHPHVFPRRLIAVDAMPLTKNGKIDRAALRDRLEAPRLAQDRATSDVRGQIAAIWRDLLGQTPRDEDSFFDLGGTSLQLIEAHARMEASLDSPFDIALMFDVPRLGDLAARLSESPDQHPQDAPKPTDDTAIAIVGMAARLPGGITTLDGFWDVIVEGRGLVERFAPDALTDTFDAATRARPDYVPARAILRDVDQFDPAFFGMLPAEAARIDPQGRIFLEVCQQALDAAGLDPTRTSGRVGLFAGSSMSTYLLENLLTDDTERRAFTSGFQIDYTNLAGNVGDDIPSRTAQKLGLTGPALSVTTACSTGLVAVIQAVEALRAGRLHAALAGGVSITFPQRRGYLAQEGGMVSLDGTCRPFDADANGTVFGDGAGVVVLKRLSDALAEGDTIHAVIQGTGLGNDGGRGMSYTAPSVTGQAEAITEAHRDAGVTAHDIGYVECHGTATPLGDPVEIAGLKQAFGPFDTPCALGAVKGNTGHLDAAAGIIGLIKTALVLERGMIPPIAHHRRINPKIDLSGSGFTVPTAPQPWTGDDRRAGVSAFGVGGSNAHVVLGAAPDLPERQRPDAPVALPLSAKTPEALAAMASDLAEALDAAPDLDLQDVARTLQSGRRIWPHRAGVVARTPQTAATALRRMRGSTTAAKAPRLVALLPGQGAQYPGMAAALYAAQPHFADALDEGLSLLADDLSDTLRGLLLRPEGPFEDAARTLAQTRLAQPSLLLTEVALASLWQARGAEPDLFIGHSVGELAAAVLAGVMALPDALYFVTRRGALMQAQAPGGMTAVTARPEELLPLLDDTLDLAARNAPDQQVVAGPAAALDAFETRLSQAGLSYRRLRSSHAFHSQMMDAVVPDLLAVAQDMPLRAPDRPILSTVTGNILTEAQATDPAYWANQARACVDFHAALETLAQRDGPRALLEVGPGRTLTALAAQTLAPDSYVTAVPSLPDPAQADTAPEVLAQATLRLWAAGLDVDLSDGVSPDARKVPLPSYPFQRRRCWVDPPAAHDAPSPSVTDVPSAPMTQTAPTVLPQLLDTISDMSGMEVSTADAEVTFLELGLDSLFLGQLTQEIARTFKVQFGFRRLTTDLGTPRLLADFILSENPSASPAVAPEPAATVAPPAAVAPAVVPTAPAQIPAVSGDLGTVMQAQMATMQALFTQQLAALGAAPATAAAVPSAAAPAPVALPPDTQKVAPTPKPEGGGRRIKMISNAELTDDQRVFARDLAERYSAKFPSSKAYTDAHRPVLADPRTAAGFHADWKELAFPIVAKRAKGAYIHDLDGNDLVDLVNGFGQTAFGHSPDFVNAAVARQLELGYALGPQAERAGPLAEKFARAVGHERVSFCNTGTEAVIAAVRAARTATGREKVVLFDKSYHGQHDEVLVKPGAKAGALPSAPGIPRGALGNVVVLPFASAEALDYIRDNLDDLAAVLIEPVRSRYPATRPEQFVRDIKALTDDVHTALIIDEVVTGFRTDARGMQGVWGLQGDMAIYGKVVGGGLPIGVVAGAAAYMDALDGGSWQYGDDSRPEAMPTFVAGTFVRHPLVLAAVEATLDHMAEAGDRLWVETPKLLSQMAKRMRAALEVRGLPDVIEDYSSWLVVDLTEQDPRATLLYPLMRLAGVHVMDGFCWFLTTEHGQAEVDRVVEAFESALDTLLATGILAEVRRSDAPPLTPATRPIPLTPSQREIWMRHQLGGLSAVAFNESGTLYLEGDLDRAALETAVSQLIARRDALRLRFARDGSGFTVADGPQLTLPVEPGDTLDAALAEEAETPFDLTDAAPIRVRLFEMNDARHALVITAHHIVLDGWSFGLILDDLAALYGAARQGTPADLPEAPAFADHARRIAAPPADHRAFWKETFSDAPPLAELPTDRPRKMCADRPGATVVHEIPRQLVEDLKTFGARHGCTLFTAAFAAMQTLVHRLSGATDMTIGVPTAAQQSTAPMDLVGHCVNLLPIRSGADPMASASDHLTSVRDQVFAALDHDGLTFSQILEAAQVPRRLDRLPLTEIEFNLEEPADLTWPGLAADFEANGKAAVTFDLFFNLVSTDAGLRIEAHYATDLFDAETVRTWARSYEALIVAMAQTPDAAISGLPLTASFETNDEAPMDDGDLAPMMGRLAEVCAAQPHKTAIETCEGAQTYADLWARSGAVAARLQAQGIQGRVAVSLPRGGDLIPTLLGVLRAGCAFVPLDPKQPDGRLIKILDDAKPSAVITDQPGRFSRRVVITPDAIDPATPAPTTVTASHPAYVIYTSGSTGQPKGVEIPHGALTNLLTSMIETPGLAAEDRLLAVTTAMFDISILEMFGPLLAGATVVVAPSDEVIDGFQLADRVNRGDITVMQATPTLWSILLTAGLTPPLHFRAWTGGEPLPSDLARDLLATGATVWNLYGPTETTIWSAVKHVTGSGPITIGGPIARTTLHILDDNGRACPTGVVGELNIGGAGLAIGYAGQPEKTAAAFREMPLDGDMRRLYATGDLARLTPTGEVEVLGRRDAQVKLRGFRIDLGEIETALRAQPGVARAAVALQTGANGDAKLVGYVVGDLNGPALAQALARDLPDYMIPTAWMALDALPQTANGKLDRRALPAPEATPRAVETGNPPATETERRLTALWSEVLNRDISDVTATLIDLGADSLTVFRLAARMLAEGLELEARDLFEHPSVRALAAHHDARAASGTAPSKPKLSAFRGGARRGGQGGGA